MCVFSSVFIAILSSGLIMKLNMSWPVVLDCTSSMFETTSYPQPVSARCCARPTRPFVRLRWLGPRSDLVIVRLNWLTLAEWSTAHVPLIPPVIDRCSLPVPTFGLLLKNRLNLFLLILSVLYLLSNHPISLVSHLQDVGRASTWAESLPLRPHSER
jgi:hypothetical protein